VDHTLTNAIVLCHAVLCCAPQAVEADAIDILAVQAPNCKQLPDSLIDMLQAARTSVLVYNRKHEGGAAE
jgi:hypothetical protein